MDKCREKDDVFIAASVKGDAMKERMRLEGDVSASPGDRNAEKMMREKLYRSHKLMSIGSFIPGMAHEMNNSLAGIIGFAELLDMRIEDRESERELARIRLAAERCKRIVENLLCFSRRQAPQRSLEYINETIDRTLEFRAYWFRLKDIEIVKEYGKLPFAWIDVPRIQEALLNILTNAEDAVSDRGRRGRIALSTRYDSASGIISVKISDNGGGMCPPVVDRVFDPSFSTKSGGMGAGLGLPIARDIISQHCGTITVESIEGKGSTVTVCLPANGSSREGNFVP